MDESEFESGVIEAEIIPQNQLQIVIKEAGLPQSDAQFLLGKFEEDFKNVALWAKKASKIVVTDQSQKVIMEEARTGRLFLAKIRIEVEKNRKSLKEDSLRRGKAIDTVASFIKDLIIPTEQHLIRQERFVELKKEAEDARILAEAHAKMEAEALAEQQRITEENKKIREQNLKLIEEARVKEKIAEKFRQEKERELQEERNKALRIGRELQIRKEEEAKKEADKAKAEEALLKAGDTEKLQAFRLAVLAIKIPEVKSAENKRIIEDAKSHLHLAIMKIKPEEEI